MHVCFPKHLHMVIARMKLDIETEEEEEQRDIKFRQKHSGHAGR